MTQIFMPPLPSVPVMTFARGRKNSQKIKILLSEHTGQCLLGYLLRLLICTGTAFGLILWWVCCQDQPFKAYLHFCFLHVTYLQGQERANRCRNYSSKRKEVGWLPKSREGAGTTRGEPKSRGPDWWRQGLSLSPAKNSHSPRGRGTAL